MESRPTSIATIAAVQANALGARSGVGIALQAYCTGHEEGRRVAVPLGAAIRIVKGAYLEPPDVAFPKKADVDERYFNCARGSLRDRRAKPGRSCTSPPTTSRSPAGSRLHQRNDVPSSAYEFAMLYGIQRGQQARLGAQGKRLRVLISYGEYWFPWYMRRLAERPANVWLSSGRCSDRVPATDRRVGANGCIAPACFGAHDAIRFLRGFRRGNLRAIDWRDRRAPAAGRPRSPIDSRRHRRRGHRSERPGSRRLGDRRDDGPADEVRRASSSPTIAGAISFPTCRRRPTASGCAATASSIRRR